MAKNIFKKHLQIFIKSTQRTVIQRADDIYYISDGYTLLRLPDWLYNAEVRPVSPIFPALENGQSATRQAGAPLAELDGILDSMTSWTEVCRQREAAAKALAAQSAGERK